MYIEDQQLLFQKEQIEGWVPSENSTSLHLAAGQSVNDKLHETGIHPHPGPAYIPHDHNEDNFLVADLSKGNRGLMEGNRAQVLGDRGALFGVCDGMGGAASDSSLAAGLPTEFHLVAVDRENGIATKTVGIQTAKRKREFLRM